MQAKRRRASKIRLWVQCPKTLQPTGGGRERLSQPYGRGRNRCPVNQVTGGGEALLRPRALMGTWSPHHSRPLQMQQCPAPGPWRRVQALGA